MKRVVVIALLACAVLAAAMAAFAAAPKTYQVTGPVLEKTADMIVVQKGKDRWELAIDAGSKIPADLKVGDKVTLEYRMTVTSCEVKGAKPAKAEGAKA
ncbi:MAG TPA: hypothetical protein VMS93_13110, partial [Candidatus Saccharimonadales bacterium]|nr:hypothetical protein [Candidatus Saccharimonadales bacterium]